MSQPVEAAPKRYQRLGAVIVGVFLTTIAIPAITRQWADRSKELEFKSDIVAELAQLVTDTLTTLERIGFGSLPETRIRESYQRQLDDGQADLGFLRQQQATSRASEEGAEQRLLNDTLSKWSVGAGSIGSRLQGYFGDSDLPEAWQSYTRAVDNLFPLFAANICQEERKGLFEVLEEYLKKPLEYPHVRAACSGERTGEFKIEYVFLVRELLPARQDLVDRLVRANADGYSTTWSDFVRDLNPLR